MHIGSVSSRSVQQSQCPSTPLPTAVSVNPDLMCEETETASRPSEHLACRPSAANGSNVNFTAQIGLCVGIVMPVSNSC